MIKIYGLHRSRAARCMWLLEEIGQEYEHIQTDHHTDAVQKAEFLKLNPNGKVPVMVDDDVVLWESMAINLYLAKRYGGEFWPSDLKSQGLVMQWSFWAMAEVEPPELVLMAERLQKPEDQRDPEMEARGLARLNSQVEVLDRHLQGREYLISDTFSLADLNLASVLAISKAVQYDYGDYSNASAWIDRCLARPAYARARG